MRLLVTGCGRSGTQWISRALTAAGVPCGHEQAFTPYEQHLDGWTAESSWPAAPHTPIDGVYVLHLVRHPLAQIASRMAKGGVDPRRKRWHAYSARWIPQLYEVRDPVERCGWQWVGWNWLVAADERVRLEDITAADVTRWARLVDPDAAGISELPPPSNRSERTPQPVTWAQVGRVPGLVETAVAYGYADDRRAHRQATGAAG